LPIEIEAHLDDALSARAAFVFVWVCRKLIDQCGYAGNRRRDVVNSFSKAANSRFSIF
jgi:hypothetical protein